MKNLMVFGMLVRKSALTKLEKFISNGIDDYDQDRNFPFKDGTSKLSPHLHLEKFLL